MIEPIYNPFDWHWIVGGDESRYWSSAVGAYVEELPEGAGVTRIVSEAELTDVLAVYGLPGPVAIVPDRVTARQFKLQLLAADLIDDVEAWIATQPRAVQIAYEYSGTFVRDEPMMQAGFAALGFTEQQVYNFFAAAAEL